MIFIFGLWKKREKVEPIQQQRQKDPVALWLSGNNSIDTIIPTGYVPLSKNEDVRTCIHKIADLTSSMTIMLMENGDNGDSRLRNELAKKIDIYPNKMMTRKNFIYKIVTDMLITGNSVVIPEIKQGLIDNLVICSIDSVSFSGNELDYTITYKGVTFDSDELLHFVFIPDDYYPFKGQGFVQIMKDTVSSIVQANATKQSFLQSKWKPSLIIKVESDAEELQSKEHREKILDSYIDNSEAGKPWLIPASEISIDQVKPLTLNDLAINEGIELDKKALAGAFGIPPFMLGVGTFNRDEYNNFISSVIMPIAKVIEQELTKKLVFSNSWYFKFNARSLYQYNISELTSHVRDLTQLGMMNRNEARNMFDLSPVEGLDEYSLLENYIPVSDIGNQKKLIQDNTTNQTE